MIVDKFKDIENIELILENIYYDESSKSCLKMKVNRSSLKIGDDAGSLNKSCGYYEITVNYNRYLAHRLIMKMHGFCIKDKAVDHINGIRIDNRISNLRLVDAATNQRNRKRDCRNKTGITGVRRISIVNGTNTKVNEYYEASWNDIDGRYFRKKFSITIYGETTAFEMAKKWRIDSILKLNEILKDSSYTERHITSS